MKSSSKLLLLHTNSRITYSYRKINRSMKKASKNTMRKSMMWRLLKREALATHKRADNNDL